MAELKKIGLIVNPLAGIGGRVALKGSDGADVVKKALALGAVRLSPKRAGEALKELLPVMDQFQLVTYPGEMGEDEAKLLGFSPTVVGSISKGNTTAEDTKHAARDMLNQSVELIIFAGGDGTARDMFDAVGTEVPVVGIPAGVKIHSGVYGSNPTAAGQLAALFISNKVKKLAELEVMDIDEEAFREGVVRAKLYGYLKTPDEPKYTQGAKASSGGVSDEVFYQAIAERIIKEMQPGKLYLVGSGTTPRAIMEKLGMPNTLLGIDVVQDNKLLTNDATEMQLLELLEGKEAEIIVTPVGGQGYIFGRGNQQLSPDVIRRVGIKNIKIISSPNKINALPHQKIRVDTGDAILDAQLRGPRRVITNYTETCMVDVI